MSTPSKQKALNFLGSGGDSGAQATTAAPGKRGEKIGKSPIKNILNPNVRTSAIEILGFFSAKKTEVDLRKSVKTLRDSLVNTFDIAALLKGVIIGITKQLETAPSKLKGGGGGLGILGFLKNGIINLVGGLGAKILGILGGIISLIPMFAGFVMPALVLGGITFAVMNEDFRDKIKNMLPGSSTDDTVDEQIEAEGGAATAEALRKEQAEKRASRNPLQNFLFGTVMGEDAEYDKQIRRAEEAESTGSTGSGTTDSTAAPPARSTTSLIPGARPKGTGTEGDPVVEGEDRELLLKLMIAEAGGEGELGMAAVGRSVLNRSGLIQGGDVGAGTFMSRSGSLRDVIQAKDQYQPYSQGKLNRELTSSERARAEAALRLAEDREALRKRLIQAGKTETEAQRIGASTGFRTQGAYYDASQEVNVTELGGHRFNTAGNRDLKLPSIEIVPPPRPPEPKPESLVEGENVSTDISKTKTQEIAREEGTDMAGNIAILPMGMPSKPTPEPVGGESVINPTPATGGSPSIAFLTPFNPDSVDSYTSKLLYNIMDA